MNKEKPSSGDKVEENSKNNVSSKETKKERKPPRGQILFNSNFECGNLGRVKTVNENEYELYVNSDTNNPLYRLWFYFSVRNTKKQQKVVFSIMNFSKTKSLYRQGMSPVVKSERRPTWERIPSKQVFYYRLKGKNAYILSYVFQFDNPDDTYYFAYCYPYSYTRLQRYLFMIEKLKLKFFQRKLLCRTLQHRRLDLLTITKGMKKKRKGKRKKTVVICARVHPGETTSSIVLHGLISFLVSSHPGAQLLRDHIIFKIVPMLNPDGVFMGNYRCSSVGNDLNRFWLNPNKNFHPTIYALRNLLLKLKKDDSTDLNFFLDIHSHSVSDGAFMYCNCSNDILKFPRLLGIRTPFFSFENSKVCKDSSKLGSGRRALGELLKISPNCFTMEVSFYCYSTLQLKNIPYKEEDLLVLGKCIAKTFIDFYHLKMPKRY